MKLSGYNGYNGWITRVKDNKILIKVKMEIYGRDIIIPGPYGPNNDSQI